MVINLRCTIHTCVCMHLAKNLNKKTKAIFPLLITESLSDCDWSYLERHKFSKNKTYQEQQQQNWQ